MEAFAAPARDVSVSTFGCQANYIYDFYVTNELKMLSLMGQFGLDWLTFRLGFSMLQVCVSSDDNVIIDIIIFF